MRLDENKKTVIAQRQNLWQLLVPVSEQSIVDACLLVVLTVQLQRG